MAKNQDFQTAIKFSATKKPAKYYPIVWQKNPDFQTAIKFSATKKPAKYYTIVGQKNPDCQANQIAITCCNQL